MAIRSKENEGCGAAAERANFLCLSAVRKCSWSRSTEVTVGMVLSHEIFTRAVLDAGLSGF